MGEGPLNRLYQASDGWLYLAARADDLKRCSTLADLAGRSDAELERELTVRMVKGKTADWVQQLTASGIGAHRVVGTLPELMTDSLTVSRGLAVTRDHEGFGPITTTSPGVRLSRTPVTIGRVAPKPGSDAASEIGRAHV